MMHFGRWADADLCVFVKCSNEADRAKRLEGMMSKDSCFLFVVMGSGEIFIGITHLAKLHTAFQV